MLTFKEVREQSGMNLKQFSEYFEIPYSTIQNWEGGHRCCPEYLLKLMQYKIETAKEAPTIEEIQQMKHIATSEEVVMEYYDETNRGSFLLLIDNEWDNNIIASYKEINITK